MIIGVYINSTTYRLSESESPSTNCVSRHSHNWKGHGYDQRCAQHWCIQNSTAHILSESKSPFTSCVSRYSQKEHGYQIIWWPRGTLPLRHKPPLDNKEPPMAASLLQLATAADCYTELLPSKVSIIIDHDWHDCWSEIWLTFDNHINPMPPGTCTVGCGSECIHA